MLLDIAKLPTAENSSIHLHPGDNVAVARVPLGAGAELQVEGVRLKTRDAIPAGHKVALREIRPGKWCCAMDRPSAAPACLSIPAVTSTPTICPSRNCI